jgi:hypothetical protein
MAVSVPKQEFLQSMPTIHASVCSLAGPFWGLHLQQTILLDKIMYSLGKKSRFLLYSW